MKNDTFEQAKKDTEEFIKQQLDAEEEFWRTRSGFPEKIVEQLKNKPRPLRLFL